MADPGPTAPKRVVPPPRRLGSLHRPASSFKQPPRRPGARPPPKKAAAPTTKSSEGETVIQCPKCHGTDVSEDDDNGSITCNNCFIVITEGNIVAEVTFDEAANGRANVQGGVVDELEGFSTSVGQAAKRKGFGGETNKAADDERQGRELLRNLVTKLGITDSSVVEGAINVWRLAKNIQFGMGRTLPEVIGACLYTSCRRDRQNRILMIDIADIQQVCVTRFGHVWKDLVKELFLEETPVGHQYVLEIEPLVQRFCEQLEFDEDTRQVTQDAIRIIRRMNRDWLVPGRHPAGLCGAAVILAARMNNYHRSVREVVYIAKIADATVAKRIDEFCQLKTATLSVNDFRLYANKMTHQADPPAMNAAALREQARLRKRREFEEYLRSKGDVTTGVTVPITIEDDSDSDSEDETPPPGQRTHNDSAPGAPSNQLPTPQGTQDEPTPGTLASHKRKAVDDQVADSQKRQRLDGQSAKRGSTSSSSPPTEQHSPAPTQERTRAGGKRRATETQSAESQKKQRVNGPSSKQSSSKRTASKDSASTTPQPRFDADGFAIPALPTVDPALLAGKPAPKKRGRKKKTDKPEPPRLRISEEELAAEDWLEVEMEAMMEQQEMTSARDQQEAEKIQTDLLYREKNKAECEERAKALASEQQEADAQETRARREANDMGDHFGETPSSNGESNDVSNEALELEFANDPEVNHYILSEEEVRNKERIWVADNAAWLRRQAEKEIQKEIDAEIAAEIGPTIKRGRKPADKSVAGGRKKRSRLGDGTVLTDSATPITTAAEAMKAMLDKRAPKRSTFINTEAFDQIYGITGTPASATSPSTAAPSVSQGTTHSRTTSPATEPTTGGAEMPTTSAPQSPEPAPEPVPDEEEEAEPEDEDRTDRSPYDNSGAQGDEFDGGDDDGDDGDGDGDDDDDGGRDYTSRFTNGGFTARLNQNPDPGDDDDFEGGEYDRSERAYNRLADSQFMGLTGIPDVDEGDEEYY